MKLRNKLILSCAALAAVATTAVSTTYAWYTSNVKVEAQGLQASTEDSGSKLLLIADGIDSTTKNAIDPANLSWKTTLANVTEVQPENGITPLAYQSTNKVLRPLDRTTGKTEAEGTVDADGYLHFVLYLRNASTAGSTNVKMTITIFDNVAADHTTAMTAANLPQKAVVKNDLYTNALSTSELVNYRIDARRALACDLEKTTVGASTTTDEGTYKLANGTYLNAENDASSYAAAVGYYNDLMTPTVALDGTNATTKGSPDHLDTWTTGTAVTNFVEVPSDTAGDGTKYVKLDFKIYLDGWDPCCYDGCQGQYFNFALKFEVQE